MFGRSKDDVFFDAFHEHATRSVEAAALLLQMLEHVDRKERLALDIGEKESAGDRLTHETVKRLHETWITPLDRFDIHGLITNLERVGDEAVNVAERASEEDVEVPPSIVDELNVMAVAALDMLHLALDAFVREDDEQAVRVLGLDDEVDARCAGVIATVTTWVAERPGDARSGLRAIRVAKCLERIADHATNVAEGDIFMVRGDDVRHGLWPNEATGSSASVPPLRWARSVRPARP